MGPVFLLHVRIVIFFVGPRAGELDARGFGPLLAEVKQVGIDELTAVVGVDAAKWERQAPFDLFQCGNDPELCFAHHGLPFHPAGGDIDTVQGVDKLSGC